MVDTYIHVHAAQFVKAHVTLSPMCSCDGFLRVVLILPSSWSLQKEKENTIHSFNATKLGGVNVSQHCRTIAVSLKGRAALICFPHAEYSESRKVEKKINKKVAGNFHLILWIFSSLEKNTTNWYQLVFPKNGNTWENLCLPFTTSPLHPYRTDWYVTTV